jgi:hypothetical protein
MARKSGREWDWRKVAELDRVKVEVSDPQMAAMLE